MKFLSKIFSTKADRELVQLVEGMEIPKMADALFDIECEAYANIVNEIKGGHPLSQIELETLMIWREQMVRGEYNE